MVNKIEISNKTIISFIAIILAIWLVYQIRDIIFLVFVSFIIVSALKPWVEYLGKYRIPKIISALAVYIIFLGFIGFAGSSIIPPLVTQSVKLGEILPKYITHDIPFLKIDPQTIIQQIAPLSQNVLNITLGLFSDIIAVITVLIVSIYLILEDEWLDRYITFLVGKDHSRKLITTKSKVEERLGGWLRGQLTLMVTIGLFSFIGLSILGIPYVLPLAIIAGIMEIIPTIGPIISAVPAILIGLTISPFFALSVVLIYFIIHQLENQLIYPVVMKKMVGVPPLITLISLMVGANLAGITGAVLAIPIVVTVETVIDEYYRKK